MAIPEASAKKVAVALNSFGLYDRVGLGPGIGVHMYNCNRYLVMGEGFEKKIGGKSVTNGPIYSTPSRN